jgi:hypothetical protein
MEAAEVDNPVRFDFNVIIMNRMGTFLSMVPCLVVLSCLLSACNPFKPRVEPVPVFEDLVGDFRQQGSGVCVIYGHTLALAETDPEDFLAQITAVEAGWRVRLADGIHTVVRKKDLERTSKNEFSAGRVDNPVNIYAVAVSQRCGGYNFEDGKLDYGNRNYSQFIGSGLWVLYDDHKPEGQRLSDGLDRLVKETGADGILEIPSTIGFGELGETATPYVQYLAGLYGLVSGHDFSVSSYDPDSGNVLLRNPHRPLELIPVPVDVLRQVPAGIDFMEEKE